MAEIHSIEGLEFVGMGASASAIKKPASPTPPVAPIQTPQKPPASALPKWLPWALGGVGLLIVVGILFTSKGKD